MNINKWIITGVLVVTGCVSTDDGRGVEAIENMSELSYNNFKNFVRLGVKIAASRSLDEGLVSQNDLNAAAVAVETLRDATIVPGATSLILPALENAGLTSDEIMLILLIAEQQLLKRGALDWLDPETGLVALSPRTKEVLTLVAGSLRSAATVTQAEVLDTYILALEFQK